MKLVAGMNRQGLRGRAALMTFVGLASTPVSWGQSPETVGDWARRAAFPIATLDLGRGSDDLQPLAGLIGAARVVALGESGHEADESPAFRNRLFEFLVDKMGFTAIGVETSFAEAITVDDYVQGGAGDLVMAVRNARTADSRPLEQNRRLIEWMRSRNARPGARKLHFYGINLTGWQEGSWRDARLAVDLALAYVGDIDPEPARSLRRRLDPLLAHFTVDGYRQLAPCDRDALTAGIADLQSLMDMGRVMFTAAGGAERFEIAQRHAVMAGQLVELFRTDLAASSSNPPDYRDNAMVRESAMADTVRWILEREGPKGRVLLFAHNFHVKKGPARKHPYPDFFPGLAPTGMGEYLHALLGSSMVVLGFTHRTADEALGMPSPRAGSVEQALAGVGAPVFVLSLRPSAKEGTPPSWLETPRPMRFNDRYWEVSPSGAFDALVYVDRATAVRPMP